MNVPQLRFKGFKGDWDKLLLKEVIENIVSGVSVNSIDKPASPNTLGVLKTSCISKGRFYPAENKEVLEAEVNRVKVNPISSSILISRMNTPQLVGEIGYVNENFPNLFLPDRLWMATTIPTVNSKWLTFLLTSNKYNSKILSLATGTSNSMKNISKEQFLSLEIKIPLKDEQDKISEFLTLLERKIHKQQEKIEKLEQFKHGMMQKVFSQELRFKDEEDGEFSEWKDTTFGDVSISMQYGMNAAAKEFDGENKYIRITDIDEVTRKYIEDGKVSPVGKLSEEYRIKQGDILFARTGASTGKSYLYRESEGKIYYAGFLIRMRVGEGVDSRLVYYQTLLKEYDQWVKVMSMRSGQPGINAQEYSSYEFKLPSFKEQNKIADFLDGIEKKIEKERGKLILLEEKKRGFMWRMFV